MSESLSPSSACPRPSSTRSQLARSTPRSASRRSCCPTRSRASTSWPSRRPDRARRSRSRCRSSSARAATTRARRRSCSCRPASSRVQVTEELEPLAEPKGLRVASVYGGVPLRAQGKRAKSAHVLVATPGRLEDLVQRRAGRPLAGHDPRARRGRPHARHGLPAAGRQARAAAAAQPPDDVLLGHARRRGRRARARVHEQPVPLRGRAARRATPGEIEHHFVSVTADTKVETLVEHLTRDRGLDARLRPHQARRRPAGRRSSRAHGVDAVAMHGDLSQRARERALERFESGKVDDAGRHRRRRPRPRPRRHHARHQLRPAGGGQGLRAPHRPHRPRGPQRHGRSRSSCPSSRPTRAASPTGSATATSSRRPA